MFHTVLHMQGSVGAPDADSGGNVVGVPRAGLCRRSDWCTGSRGDEFKNKMPSFNKKNPNENTTRYHLFTRNKIHG